MINRAYGEIVKQRKSESQSDSGAAA